MFKHHPIIIPEINNQDAICDYLIQTANILAKKKYPVYIYYLHQPPTFKKNLSQILPHLYSFTPIKILPFNRFYFIQRINIHISFFCLYFICFLRHKSIPFFWLFYPQVSSLIKFSPPPSKIIYDIVDFYTSPNPRINKILYYQKKYLLKKASLVVAISQSLIKNYKKIFSKAFIYLVPQGFNLIKKNLVFHPKINKLQKLSHKVGFIGGINNRLNYQLLFDLISKTPKYNYIFIGPLGSDNNVSPKPINSLAKKLFSFKNVYHIDLVPKSQISEFINIFDIAIIPYDIRDKFNLLCYPMKIFEYFSLEKPVVSTSIKELEQFPDLIKIGNTSSEWQKHLGYFFSHPLTFSQKNKAKKLAQKNSWKNKINQILKLISKSQS